jgi:hypothetical protein
MDAVIKQTLSLIKQGAKLLQSLNPGDVKDLEYAAQIGAKIEELINGLNEQFPNIH